MRLQHTMFGWTIYDVVKFGQCRIYLHSKGYLKLFSCHTMTLRFGMKFGKLIRFRFKVHSQTLQRASMFHKEDQLLLPITSM